MELLCQAHFQVELTLEVLYQFVQMKEDQPPQLVLLSLQLCFNNESESNEFFNELALDSHYQLYQYLFYPLTPWLKHSFPF